MVEDSAATHKRTDLFPSIGRKRNLIAAVPVIEVKLQPPMYLNDAFVL